MTAYVHWTTRSPTRVTPEVTPTTRVGAVVGGRYRLDEIQAESPRFVTYLATNLDTDSPVCVKCRRQLKETEDAGRFRREAGMLRRLRHENVSEILDFGQLEDGTPYIVKPHLQGDPLSRMLRDGPLDPDVVASIVQEVATGLAFAHQFGVFHLAVEPRSVFVDEHVKVLGFLEARWHRIDTAIDPPQAASPEIEVFGLGMLIGACLGFDPRLDVEEADTEEEDELLDIARQCVVASDTRYESCEAVAHALTRWRDSVARTQHLPAVRPRPAFPRPGDVFADRYRIEEMIGEGGYARVFRAVTVDTHQLVALKLLRPDKSADSTDAIRFVREGKLVFSLLTNPHTISVYGYGESDSGLLYIAFEFVDGDALETLIGSVKLGGERVVRILEQCLVSLAEAHAMGVLHRDIKPSNIMLSDREGVRDWVTIVDFGVAKITTDVMERKELTVAGKAVGTPRYMAPEQILGETLGPETDLYSLGLVAFEMLTGKPAVTGETVLEILGAQLDPQSLILRGHNVPAPLALIVNRMIRKDRTLRFQTAREVLTALRGLDEEVGDATVDTGARA